MPWTSRRTWRGGRRGDWRRSSGGAGIAPPASRRRRWTRSAAWWSPAPPSFRICTCARDSGCESWPARWPASRRCSSVTGRTRVWSWSRCTCCSAASPSRWMSRMSWPPEMRAGIANPGWTERAFPLIALCALVPASARSETSWNLAPSLALSQRRDDNLFSRAAAPEQDWITALQPGVLFEAGSLRWSLGAGYTQAAERYADNPSLDTMRARQEASLRWESRATRTLETTFTASYLQTTTASELYRSSGFDFGRLPARRLQLTPTLAQGLSETTTLLADLTATRDEIIGAASTLDTALPGIRPNPPVSRRPQT